MADADPLAAYLARATARYEDDEIVMGDYGVPVPASVEDVPRLLAALKAALGVHALTAFHRHTNPCDRHRYRVAERSRCPDCKVVEWTGCETCRDEFGNPARAEDCSTRQAITRALLGEEKPNG